jgi:hypothetical protein
MNTYLAENLKKIYAQSPHKRMGGGLLAWSPQSLVQPKGEGGEGCKEKLNSSEVILLQQLEEDYWKKNTHNVNNYTGV